MLNCGLLMHPQGYHLTCIESVQLLFHSPYARRHWAMSKAAPRYSLGHKVIAILEGIPVLGGLASLIEKIIVYLTNRYLMIPPYPRKHAHALNFHLRHVDPKTGMRKMLKNARKAIVEHRIKAKAQDREKIAALHEVFPKGINFSGKVQEKSLTLSHAANASQGPRPTMEDAHFYQNLPNDKVAMGIFDGHGGAEVANYCNAAFVPKFQRALLQTGNNVFRAFELVIHELHTEVIRDNLSSGSTAVICYVDLTTHLIYTATVGDSEAKIYRKIGSVMKSIPLSCVRDMQSSKDEARVLAAIARWAESAKQGVRAVVKVWKAQNSKGRRYPPIGGGVNVSRSIGDRQFREYAGNPVVIHKPKITVHQLMPQDRIILACDGVCDYVNESVMVELMAKNHEATCAVISEEVRKKTQESFLDLQEKYTDPNIGDNVTVIAVKVNELSHR